MISYMTVNILGCLLIVTSFLVVIAKTPKIAAGIYAVQSLILVSIFLVLSAVTGSPELQKWAITATITKVIGVPAIMFYTIKKVGDAGKELPPLLNPVVSAILVIVELGVCFLVVQSVDININNFADMRPALAISLAHFFVGLTCIVSQRSILKQVFGYCLMENGSHLTLALLAPTAPSVVEIGIATDAIFAVIIMAVLAVRIYKKTQSLDANELMELKG